MKKLIYIIKLCSLGALIGILGGLIGVCFAHLLSFVSDLRQTSPWLILLLPVGAILTTLLYRFFHMQEHQGTNEIILCLANKKEIRPIAAPLIFISCAITHLFGGSAGREGAALQLGGGGAAALCTVLRLKDDDRSVAVISGMSAVFAALFGTPLTAAFFVMEFKLKPKSNALAFLPCLISAIIAAKLSAVLGVTSEAVHLNFDVVFSLTTVIKISILALGLSILGHFMCYIFHLAGPLARRLVSNDFLRAALFSVAIVVMTAIVGDMRYNGSGMNMAISAVEGKADWFDFVLKLIFSILNSKMT